MSDFAESMSVVLRDCTTMYRKGEEVVVEGPVTHVYAMDPVDAASLEEVKIDVHFCVIGVDMAKAKEHAGGFAELLMAWPTEAWGYPTQPLKDGPSYISVGGVLDAQDNALCMFALGEALGMWKVVTPERLHITGPDADKMAGNGFVMMSGWDPAQPRQHNHEQEHE
jgi:hypothetical protein